MRLDLTPKSVIAFEQVSTWDPRIVTAYHSHYTGSRGAPPGKKLGWAIHTLGRLRGVIVLGEPAYKLAPRRRLGLTDARPLHGTVCCSIYRVEPRISGEPSASEILKAWHQVATAAWVLRYGWEPIHWETMVDAAAVSSEVPGACFRRAGYRSLGETTGRGAKRPSGHSHSTRVWGETSPKLVLYRGPLSRLST